QNGPFRGGLDHIAQNALRKSPPVPRSRPPRRPRCSQEFFVNAALVIPGAGPLGPLASTLPVRSYRCASLLIPASCRSGVRPGTSQCPSGSALGQGLDAVALPQMPDSPPPVTAHRILRLPTASLPCSPD